MEFSQHDETEVLFSRAKSFGKGTEKFAVKFINFEFCQQMKWINAIKKNR